MGRARRHRGLAMLVAAVTAAMLSAGVASAGFADVDPDSWYVDAVDWLAAEGLTTGTQKGCFQPERVLTRAEAAVFLHRLAGEPVPARPQPFIDVSGGWSAAAIGWMAESGITTGVGQGRFAPTEPVSRGQFAVFLHRYANEPPASAHPFDDITRDWQHDAVAWLAEAGITTGTSSRTFSPDRFVTRAQLAAFLHRFAGTPVTPRDDGEATPCLRSVVIHGVGDVNFDPGYGPNPQQPFSYAWAGLGGLFLRDDLTIINLECAPSTLGSAVPKTYNFRCPLDSLPAAMQAGVDVANLANNHGADFGIPALVDGVANVSAAGMVPVGAGGDLAAATTPAVFERNGHTIAVLGFNTVSSHPAWHASESRPGMAFGDIATMTAAVEAASARADFVFVTIHWGIEKTAGPAADDIPRAHALIDAGADAVFGHGPHRLQPLEFYGNRPIFWSLGNFVWHTGFERTAVAEVTITADGDITGRMLPAVIESKGHPVLAG